MIEELRPYEAYEDVAGPWPGRLPRHWATRPAFGAFVPVRERNNGMKERQILSLSYGRIVIKPADKLRGLVPRSFETYQIVNPGNVVLRTTDLQNDHTSLRVGLVRDRGIVTSAYLALKTKAGVLPEYGYQVLNAWDLSKAIYWYGSGLRQNLDFRHFKRMAIPLPPPEEQMAIVRFLDYAGRRIDQFIREKKKLIALFNEQKQALVHLAVTRGIDSQGVPIFPRVGEVLTPVVAAVGRIPWLSELPSGWKMMPSGQLFEPRKELAREGDQQLSATQAYGVIHQAEFERRVGRRVVKISMHLEKRRHVERDDFVISMRSFQGGLERAWVSGCIRSSYVVLRPRFEVDTRYFAYLFKSTSYIRALQATANFIRDGQDLNFDNFRLVELPLPPVEVQRAIAEHIDGSTTGLTNGVEKARQEIRLLAEYRTRLISDVVTGQLDVRAAAASLPALELGGAPTAADGDDDTGIDDGEAA